MSDDHLRFHEYGSTASIPQRPILYPHGTIGAEKIRISRELKALKNSIHSGMLRKNQARNKPKMVMAYENR